MRYIIITCVFFISFLKLFSQDKKTGNFYVYASPSGTYRVKIDGVLQEKSHVFDVKPGNYKIQIWSPNYYTTDTTFSITQEPCTLKVDLNKTPELIKFEDISFKHDNLYRKSMLLGVGTVACLSIGAVALKYNSKVSLEKVKTDNGQLYNVDGYNIEKQKTANNNYYFNNTVLISSLTVASGCIIYGCFTLLKKRMLEKPLINEDKSFLVDNFGLIYNKKQTSVSVSIRF